GVRAVTRQADGAGDGVGGPRRDEEGGHRAAGYPPPRRQHQTDRHRPGPEPELTPKIAIGDYDAWELPRNQCSSCRSSTRISATNSLATSTSTRSCASSMWRRSWGRGRVARSAPT